MSYESDGSDTRTGSTAQIHSHKLKWENKSEMGHLQLLYLMTRRLEPGCAKKREKVQNRLWNEVGSIEHISLPRLKDTVKKEFNLKDDRLVQAQVDLMQTERRIRIESRVKVWIKQPQDAGHNGGAARI